MSDSPVEKLAKIDLKCGHCTYGFVTVGIYQIGYHFSEGLEIYCPMCKRVIGRFEAKIPSELFEVTGQTLYGKID